MYHRYQAGGRFCYSCIILLSSGDSSFLYFGFHIRDFLQTFNFVFYFPVEPQSSYGIRIFIWISQPWFLLLILVLVLEVKPVLTRGHLGHCRFLKTVQGLWSNEAGSWCHISRFKVLIWAELSGQDQVFGSRNAEIEEDGKVCMLSSSAPEHPLHFTTSATQ